MKTPKLQPHDIKAACENIDRVKSIDGYIEYLGQHGPDNVDRYGEKVRHIIGQNIMGQFTDEHLGEVVLCAVVNALLDMRLQCVEDIDGIVDVSDPPCVRQVPSLQS